MSTFASIEVALTAHFGNVRSSLLQEVQFDLVLL